MTWIVLINPYNFFFADIKTISNLFLSFEIILISDLPIEPVEPKIAIFFFIYKY